MKMVLSGTLTKKPLRINTNANEGLKGAICFFVKKGDMITRILMNDDQHIMIEEASLEKMGAKIDILKLVNHYKN